MYKCYTHVLCLLVCLYIIHMVLTHSISIWLYNAQVDDSTVQYTYHKVLHDVTARKEYIGGWEVTYRCRLPPGEYIIVPTTMEEKQEDQFIIRVFSQNDLLDVRLV